MFLGDAPPARRDCADLSDALADIGLELTPTAQRLAAFQRSSLSIFQPLGGLGLLGTAGLVVLRNTPERRDAPATAHALGFADRAVQRAVWLGAGVLAASIAMIERGDGRCSSARPRCSLGRRDQRCLLGVAGRLALRGGLLERLRAD